MEHYEFKFKLDQKVSNNDSTEAGFTDVVLIVARMLDIDDNYSPIYLVQGDSGRQVWYAAELLEKNWSVVE